MTAVDHRPIGRPVAAVDWKAKANSWGAQLVHAQGLLADRDRLVRGLARRATTQRLEVRGLVATIRRLSAQLDQHRQRADVAAVLVRRLARRASHQRRRAQALTDAATELGIGLDAAHEELGKTRADLAAARQELAAVHAALPDLVQMCATTQGVSLPVTVHAMATALDTLAPGWLVAPTEGGPTSG